MDPDATLTAIRDAVAAEEWDDALDATTNLLLWLVCDGFVPTDLNKPINLPPHAPNELAMAISSLQTVGW